MKPGQRLSTYALQNNAGPEVLSHELSNATGQRRIRLEAWISNFGGSNVYLFEGDLTLSECENRVHRVRTIVEGAGEETKETIKNTNGKIDCLMPLTGSGPLAIDVTLDNPRVTIFFEGKNESGQVQTVCIRELEII